MGTFIRKVKTASGATAVQIVCKDRGKVIHLTHIGSAHNIERLELLMSLARQQLRGSQQSLFPETDGSGSGISIKQSSSTVLYNALESQYIRLGFGKLRDTQFCQLCLARMVEPASKLDSLRVLADLGIDGLKFSEDRLYRCLRRIIEKDYRSIIAKLCFSRASTQGSGISLVLYDVTTLYFETQKEDDYRKPGLSKERRLEPQIIVGLLVDQSGFPLAVQSFEGNKAETKTILPVMETFKASHGLSDVTVVADAGMLSAGNLEALAAAGYYYIVGSRLNKIPYDIAEYQKTKELTDNQIVTKKTNLEGQRVIYQYQAKRAALDLRNIEKQIEKAKRIVSGTVTARKAKFLTVTTKNKHLNQVLIDKAYALAGIKGYVTNLNIPDEKIITYYHQLWQVEASFRMAKSDLRARPIFHHKRDSIEAHLTIVFGALAISRTIERCTDLSIKQFVKALRPIRSGIVTINGKDYSAKAEIPGEVKEILNKLSPA